MSAVRGSHWENGNVEQYSMRVRKKGNDDATRRTEKKRSADRQALRQRVCEKYSDTGNRTPGYRVRGDNVSHYTISD